jgi:tyrosyl-tRNA synthetase
VNNVVVVDESQVVGERTLAGGVSVLRRGKKTLAAITVSA